MLTTKSQQTANYGLQAGSVVYSGLGSPIFGGSNLIDSVELRRHHGEDSAELCSRLLGGLHKVVGVEVQDDASTAFRPWTPKPLPWYARMRIAPEHSNVHSHGEIMWVIQWNNDLCIGHELIDTQHKRLFELTAKLYGMAVGSEDKVNLKFCLLELYKYTIFHFNEEEILMRNNSFPCYDDHKHEHEKFVATLDALALKARKDTSVLDIEILDWLSSWLVTNISIKDKMIGQCLFRDS